MNSKSTLIFGGSFDPVHIGHLIIARQVARKISAERILLVPTCANPLKNPPVATNDQRLEMLKLAVARAPEFEITDIELRRTPPSFSIDTIEAICDDIPAPAMMVGADMIRDLHRWHRVDDLLSKADLIIACRPPANSEKIRQSLLSLEGKIRTEHLEKLMENVVETSLLEISSSQIRDMISQGISPEFYLPPAVVDYINQNQIYRK